MRVPRPKVVLPIAVLVLGALAAAVLVNGRKPPARVARSSRPPLVRVLPVSETTWRLEVRSQGEVRPRTETVLAAEVAGKVVEMAPEFVAGGFFEAGHILARLDPTDYRFGAKRAEAELARARLRLAQEEKEAEIAREDWADLGSGEPDPLVLRQPQLEEARASLASADAALAKARADLERTRIRVPYAGRVREKLVDVGRFVSPGTLLGTVYATDAVEIRLPVPAREIAYVDIESRPAVTLVAELGGAWKEWAGRIVRTEGQVDSRTRMVHLVARVDGPLDSRGASAPLTPGLFVEAVIEGRTVDNVVVLPRTALRGRDRVLVVDAEDRLRWRTVKVLRVDRDHAVLSGGLSQGEMVCLSPIEAALDGMPVRVERPGVEQAASSAEGPS